jgi:phage gpG-like protein
LAQQKVKIDLSKNYAPQDREAIAQEVIERIIERTRNEGRGFNQKTKRPISLSSKPYTTTYAKKKGVSIRDVDLTLSSEMLDSIKKLTDTSRSITIGFEAGTKENDKAEGNQKGSYGKSPDPKKARPFLGITKKDLKEILDNYEPRSK